MSGAIGVTGDYQFTTQLVADTAATKQKLDTLTQQSATGLVSDTYSGLGSAASVPLNLQPQIARSTTWQANVDAATTRMSATQTVMNQLSSIASSFAAQTDSLQTDPSQISVIAAQAQSALQQVAGLLNTQVGGVYIFGGADTANPPVPDASNILASGFATQIGTAIGGLSATNAAATVATTLSIATTPASSPFSATIGTQVPSVEVGSGQDVPVGILANANLAATQTSPPSTGSSTTDLMRALATLGSLTTAQAALGQPFQDVVSDASATLNSAIGALATDEGVLGAQQSNLATVKTNLSDVSTALTQQVSAVQDVDMPTVATALSDTQTQLQASYQVIANLKNFSLVTYMPTD